MTQDDRQFYQQLFEEQNLQFQRHLSAVAESFDHKLGLIADGHELLRNEIRETRTELKQEIGLCNFKIDAVATDLKATDKRLSGKIDGVATDLKAHRADTEAHHGVYRVKEG